MLDAARAKALTAGVNVQFVQADMRRFNLPGSFAAILIAGNSLLLHVRSPPASAQRTTNIRYLEMEYCSACT